MGDVDSVAGSGNGGSVILGEKEEPLALSGREGGLGNIDRRQVSAVDEAGTQRFRVLGVGGKKAHLAARACFS